MGRVILISLCAGALLSACAIFKPLPQGYIYWTSLRGQQGIPGDASRVAAARNLLRVSAVKEPKAVLEAALPDKKVKVREWGVRYFDKDWTRYQVVLDAEIGTGKSKVKCREASTEGPVGAPVLKEVLANDGALFKAQLEGLVAACVKKATTPNPP